MSRELLQKVISAGVQDNLDSFFLNVSNAYREIEDDLSVYDDDRFTNFQTLGEIVFNPNEKLVVSTAEVSEDLIERSGKKAQYEKAKRILKDYMKYDAGIFVFSDPAGSFRFSLVYGQAEGTRKSWSNFRRFTYFVSRDQTNKTFLDRVGGCDFSSLDVIKDAFSVEKVNKEFYKEIAKYYYRLTGKNGYKRELVLPSVAEDDGKKYEEYAVRLIGRIIFCWFLKHKKSASGTPLITKEALSVSAVQNYPNYYHSILESLFFEVMNKRVKDRKPVTIPQADLIPFLNGGLFEPHANDYYQNTPNYALKIPDRWFADFFSVLEQYNFTIDENSIVDADVSVDPEMLGRIFENLLAEVVPETGETARKATGSYYTPRVIVDYMVEQSLKQYLLTRTTLPEDKLNQLLSYEDSSIELTDVERNDVIKALKEITVIDPACGSGAFPMGILHRMLLALEKVDPNLELWRRLYLGTYHPVMRRIIEDKLRKGNEQYIRKLTVIQDSIYGVDIQPVAVEIAKLRCFLSLVVDEIVLDNEENRGIEPTNRKYELLEREYQGFQDALCGNENNLYSATKQQAERFLRKVKVPKHRHYPLILRRDVIRLERQDTKVAPYWFKFPIFGVRGGIWLGLKPHCDIPTGCSLREAKLIRRKGNWFIHLTIQREVPEPVISERHILAVDLGERYLSVVCGNNGINPQFLGREVRGIRRHYAYLRKRLGERKLLSTIRKVGHTEQRKVNDICHKISRQIVDEAKETGSTIVLGDLKGIRKRAKGRRMNRIVSGMPYYKLTQFIKYKAAWDGVAVMVISEAYTSKTCHRCGLLGSRPYQGLFLCHSCGLHYNADLNGAINISKRALDYMSSAGASLAMPITQPLN